MSVYECVCFVQNRFDDPFEMDANKEILALNVFILCLLVIPEGLLRSQYYYYYYCHYCS